jgi:hypothetical protein
MNVKPVHEVCEDSTVVKKSCELMQKIRPRVQAVAEIYQI